MCSIQCCFSVCFLMYSLYLQFISGSWFKISFLNPFTDENHLCFPVLLYTYSITYNFIFGYSVIYFEPGQNSWAGWILDKGKCFLFSIVTAPTFGSTQPPVNWIPGVRQQRREADKPHHIVKIMNVWGYASTPSCSCGMQRDLTLTLIKIKVNNSFGLDYMTSFFTVCSSDIQNSAWCYFWHTHSML